MGLFSRVYAWTMAKSVHPHARWWLGGLSVAEATVFPIPPDVMLAPMVLARPAQWWRLAALTTVTSVVGGLIGYVLGAWVLDLVLPWVDRIGRRDAYDTAVRWFEQYGFWAILMAGITPVPYKVFTLSAGAAQMGLLPFFLGSLIGRGIRFFAVAGLVKVLGPAFERHLLRYIDVIGWVLVLVVLVGILWMR